VGGGKLEPRSGDAVAMAPRRYGFNGKGGVGGARKYDVQLMTALCGGSWTSGRGCLDVELSTLKLGKSCVVHSCK